MYSPIMGVVNGDPAISAMEMGPEDSLCKYRQLPVLATPVVAFFAAIFAHKAAVAGGVGAGAAFAAGFGLGFTHAG